MDFLTGACLAFVVLAASYIQASAGFSFSIFVVAIASSLELMALWQLTELVTALVIANALVALYASPHRPDIKLITPVILGLLPAVAVGVWMLSHVTDQQVAWALMLLGVVTVFAALSLVIRVGKGTGEQSSRQRFVTGMVAGLLGGTLAAPGPPLVLSLYTQRAPLAIVRVSLLSILLIFGIARLLAAQIITPNLIGMSSWVILFAPVSILGAVLGARLPPRASEKNLRRVIFSLLLVVGVMLFLEGLFALLERYSRHL